MSTFTHDRKLDLIRHQRIELHEEGLITDEEYAFLCGVNSSVDRLHTYDDVQEQYRQLKEQAEKLDAETKKAMAERDAEREKVDKRIEEMQEDVTKLAAKVATNDPMRDAAKACMLALAWVPTKLWAELFVELRMSFHRHFGRGLVCSTEHGVDFFKQVVDCCEGTAVWKGEGEYHENFRKMIRDRPRGTSISNQSKAVAGAGDAGQRPERSDSAAQRQHVSGGSGDNSVARDSASAKDAHGTESGQS